eukprot:GEMP01098105.1.p1 GENE.GEMP01098105.1~~GEMP01098105.1.p1  ORF type:complete len:107 (+),score=28.05 GEMP01098105.1:143-463(+)
MPNPFQLLPQGFVPPDVDPLHPMVAFDHLNGKLMKLRAHTHNALAATSAATKHAKEAMHAGDQVSQYARKMHAERFPSMPRVNDRGFMGMYGEFPPNRAWRFLGLL